MAAFLDISTRRELAAFLGIPLGRLTYFAFAAPARAYRTFEIPKRYGGKSRRISAPNAGLKRVQRILARELSALYEPPECVHGFVDGKGIATNASKHTRKYAVLRIDLEDFFPSIGANRIHGLFLKDPFNFPEVVANTLTELVCFDGSLPQGSPTSPVLSNLICFRMDKQLLSYAGKHHVTYTRYADDLVFSSTSRHAMSAFCRDMPDGGNAIDPRVLTIVNRNGFQVNDSKIHYSRRGTRQCVTGIVVNEKCNLPRRQYRELRVLFHNWDYAGIEYAMHEYARAKPEYAERLLGDDGRIPQARFISHIRGRLDFYQMVCSQNGKPSVPLMRLWTAFKDLTGQDVPMSLPERALLRTEGCYDYVAKAGDGGKGMPFSDRGSAFVTEAGSVITCAHCVKPVDARSIPDDACVGIEGPKVRAAVPVREAVLFEEIDIAVIDAVDEVRRHHRLRVNAEHVPQIGERVKALGYADGDEDVHIVEARVAGCLKSRGSFQVDRPFIHGMSGGPVLNSRNEVIGIVTGGSAAGRYFRDGEFVSAAALGGLSL